MSKHTPGPWHLAENTWNGDVVILGKSSRPDRSDKIAVFPRGECENEEANARLIAAAPELLEACKVCQVRVFMHDGSTCKEYRQAAAAIAAAEGRG